ncbi:MAG: hypothetical protein PW792_09945 [Acidobacteriaceae bacterium]|nr:hypothetical protein [Acidobacteriaceae bacterium]
MRFSRSGLKNGLSPYVGSMIVAMSAISAGAQALPSAHDLPGHYYFSQVQEVGSELLLKPNGQFQWLLSYGAVDQTAEGHWSTDGKTVTLDSKRPSENGVTLQLGEKTEWDANASSLFEQRQETKALDARWDRCPINSISKSDNDYVATSLQRERGPASDGVPTAAEIEQARSLTIQRGQIAQSALDSLKAHPDWQKDKALIQATDKALSDYEESREALLDLYYHARTKAIDPVTLSVPQECRVGNLERDAAKFRGVAVTVLDRQHDMTAQGIQAKAIYDQGLSASDVVVNGYAFFPLPEGRRITSVSLHLPDDAKNKETVFAVSLSSPSVLHIDADFSSEISSGFKQLILVINFDGSLTPQGDLSSGRYRKPAADPLAH